MKRILIFIIMLVVLVGCNKTNNKTTYFETLYKVKVQQNGNVIFDSLIELDDIGYGDNIFTIYTDGKFQKRKRVYIGMNYYIEMTIHQDTSLIKEEK